MAIRQLALVAFAALVDTVKAHGRLTVPRARNGDDNGAVGGGPKSVHAFGDFGSVHSKYQHGICGDAPGTPQRYNRVGEAQATYMAGHAAEFKVVVVAHHVGYFEFEFCEDAGQLSEACFAKHRLLKEGCECECPGDSSNGCSECDVCRRWWKPVLAGEMSKSIVKGYEGPVLPGQTNLAPYEFSMRYMMPANVHTSRGVLRWHYMTTDNCEFTFSSPEEFWNCADVEVWDGHGNVAVDIPFDNAALESLPVENLMPAIDAGELIGVYAVCPADDEGNVTGVGSVVDYADWCGEKVRGEYEKCRDISDRAGPGDRAWNCLSPPATGVLCQHDCSDAWFKCHNGNAFSEYVDEFTKCKGNKLVKKEECTVAGSGALSTPTSQAMEILAMELAPEAAAESSFSGEEPEAGSRVQLRGSAP